MPFGIGFESRVSKLIFFWGKAFWFQHGANLAARSDLNRCSDAQRNPKEPLVGWLWLIRPISWGCQSDGDPKLVFISWRPPAHYSITKYPIRTKCPSARGPIMSDGIVASPRSPWSLGPSLGRWTHSMNLLSLVREEVRSQAKVLV